LTVKKLLILLLLTGCVGNYGAESYIERNPHLSARSVAAIRNSEIVRGMHEDEVAASWGRPDRVTYNSWGNVWVYERYLGRSFGHKYSAVFFDRQHRVKSWSVDR
jgi:hypothetical protein